MTSSANNAGIVIRYAVVCLNEMERKNPREPNASTLVPILSPQLISHRLAHIRIFLAPLPTSHHPSRLSLTTGLFLFLSVQFSTPNVFSAPNGFNPGVFSVSFFTMFSE